MQEPTLSRSGSCGDRLKSLFREKEFLPGLLAENRDGNGSLPRSRNLISEKVSSRPSTLYGRGRADIHHGPESLTPLKAEYIGADQLPLIIFRLQLCGGPYIPIIPFHRRNRLAHAQIPELLKCQMSDPVRVIMGKWSTSQELIHEVKKRAKRNGTTQTGKHDPAGELDEKV